MQMAIGKSYKLITYQSFLVIPLQFAIRLLTRRGILLLSYKQNMFDIYCHALFKICCHVIILCCQQISARKKTRQNGSICTCMYIVQ